MSAKIVSTQRYTFGWTRNPYDYPRKRFPRSKYAKEWRMTEFMEWKVEQIRLRWRRRALVGALVLFVPPAVVIVATGLWRLALVLVLE